VLWIRVQTSRLMHFNFDLERNTVVAVSEARATNFSSTTLLPPDALPYLVLVDHFIRLDASGPLKKHVS
jgi:hypothetical protein